MNDNECMVRLETKVDNIENTLQNVQADVRELRKDIKDGYTTFLDTRIGSVASIDTKIGSFYSFDTRMAALDKKMDKFLRWLKILFFTSLFSTVLSAVTAVLHL